MKKDSVIYCLLCGILIGVYTSCSRSNSENSRSENHYKNIEALLAASRGRCGGDSLRCSRGIDSLANDGPLSVDERYQVAKARFRLYYNVLNNFEIALAYTDTLLNLSMAPGITGRAYKQFDALNYRANILYQTEKFEIAFQYFQKAQYIADTVRSPLLKSRFLHTLGMASYKGENYATAARQFVASYSAIEHDSSMRNLGYQMYGQELLDNAGLAYSRAGRKDSAFYYFMKALAFVKTRLDTAANSPDLKEALSIIEGNLAELHSEVGQKDSAELYYKSAISVNESIGRNLRDREFNQVKLADLMIEKGAYKTAKTLLDTVSLFKSLNKSHSRLNDSLELKLRLTKVLARYFTATGNHKMATQQLEFHHELEEQKWMRNAKLKMNPVESGLDNAWHEKKIRDLQKDNEIRLLQLAVLVLIGLIGIGISYHYNRNKQIKIQQLKTDKEQIIYNSMLMRRELELKNEKDISNYVALLENTESCLWSLNREMKLLAFNKHFVEHMQALTGKTPHIGAIDLLTDLNSDFYERVADGYKAAFAGNATQLLDKGFDADGGETDIAMVFKPVFDEKGDVVAVSCSRRDISQFTKLKQSLELNNEQFKNIAWLQSHILRGPLSTALGIVHLLAEPDAELTPEMKAALLSGLLQKLEELDSIVHEIVGRTNLSQKQ